MICRLAPFALAATVLCACSQPDSYIVVHSDVNCAVPPVFQLSVIVSNNGTGEQKFVPETASAELGFPNSIVLVLPGSRGGLVDVVVEALDDKLAVVGQDSKSVEISVGERTDVSVLLAPVTFAICGNGVLDPGEQCDDGNRISGDGCSFTCTLETGLGSGDGGVDDEGGTAGAPDLATGSGVPFVEVAVGGQSTCALRSDSSLWCWGNNSSGQLRLSNTSNRLTPVAVAGTAWDQVACGQTHACAVRADGSLSCWGNNGSGQLGATTGADTGEQVEVTGGPWQSVAAGMYQTCAIKQDSTLWCWGDNTNGQLGTGNTEPSPSPAQVAGQGWSQVSATFLHTCAVKQDGTLWCWGINANLEIGDPLVAFSMTPGQVGKDTDWLQVTTGYYHSCAIKKDGTLWCWGGNTAGQLGNDSITVLSPAETSDPALLSAAQTSDPVQVTPGTLWKDVSAGLAYTCGVRQDGSLWCWGDNTHAQLGDKTTDAKSTPVAVLVSGETWTMVAAGVSHTCALATSGSLWCWGDNSAGQLGIGSNDPRESPAAVVQ
jgi:cysteine-rich repeat protein